MFCTGNDRPAYSQLVVIAEAMMNRNESDFTHLEYCMDHRQL
jgi:hypothetical protein